MSAASALSDHMLMAAIAWLISARGGRTDKPKRVGRGFPGGWKARAVSAVAPPRLQEDGSRQQGYSAYAGWSRGHFREVMFPQGIYEKIFPLPPGAGDPYPRLFHILPHARLHP